MAPRPFVLAACALLLATTASLTTAAEENPAPFAPKALFPPKPSTAIRDFQSLLPAAASWIDLSVFSTLVTHLASIDALPALPSDGTPFTVFAPTNEAFLLFFAPNSSPEIFNSNSAISAVFAPLFEATTDEDTPPPILAALVDVVRYHIVPKLGTEQALVASLPTLAADAIPLDGTAFPQVLDARNGTSTRYGRSFKVADNGLLVPINRVLQPIDRRPILEYVFRPGAPMAQTSRLPAIPLTFQRFRDPVYVVGAAPQPVPLPVAPYTYALASYAGLLTARADLQIFSALLVATPALADAVLGFDRTVHPLVPTDAAFLALLSAVGIPQYDALVTRFKADRFNPQLLSEAVRLLAAVVAALPGKPSVAAVVSYHVLAGRADLASRAGPQNTLVDGAQLTIGRIGSQFFVVDADASRQDPRVVVSLPTGTGYLSVIDGVLLSLNLADALAALDADAVAALPRPEMAGAVDESGPEFSQAPREPDLDVMPTKTPAPGTVADGAGGGGDSGVGAGGGADADAGVDNGSSMADEDNAQPSLSPEDEEEAETPPDGSATPSPESDDGVCFPGDARVHTADGRLVAMSDLQAGDHVLTHPADKTGSPVFLFSHRTRVATTEMIRLETASGHVVRATRGHYVLVDGGRLRAFAAVRVGDRVHTVAGDSVVTKVSRVVAKGLYAPHALRANLVVDGVWVSGYSRAVRPRVAEALLAPLRFVAGRFGWVEPIGGALYNGADHLLRFIPRGADAY